MRFNKPFTTCFFQVRFFRSYGCTALMANWHTDLNECLGRQFSGATESNNFFKLK